MSNQFTPTLSSNRIEILDILRGVAVFGILLSNILIISGFHLTPYTELGEMHLASLNSGLFMFSFYMIIGKAYPIFCILFGVGFYMQYLKNKDQENSFVRFFVWRAFLLFIIGLLHAVIWPGDVVHYYALIGIFLLPVRKLKPKAFIAISASVLVLSMAIALSDQYLVKHEKTEKQEQLANLQFKDTSYEELKDNVQNNSIEGMFFFNKRQYKILYAFGRLKTALLQLWGLFLLGMFLYAKDLITGKMYNWKYLVIFFVLGAIGKYLAVFVTYQVRIIEHVFLSLFFITLFGMIYKSGFGKKIMGFLKPVGRMALTNYILQSVLAILVFYGVGLGLFTEVPLYGVYLISVGILLLQTIFSIYWLRKFKFGPIEWIWRTLSYNKNFSLKNRK